MRLQELSRFLKRALFSVLRSRSPRSLRHIFWLAATKNRWLVSFHRQCELNPNNCLTTTCLCPLHTLPCPTSHAAQRILCSRVLTHVHVPSEFDAGISWYIDYTLAAFGSLICCQVVNRTICVRTYLCSRNTRWYRSGQEWCNHLISSFAQHVRWYSRLNSVLAHVHFYVSFAAGLFLVLLHKGLVCRISFVWRQPCSQSLHIFFNHHTCVGQFTLLRT